MQRGNLNDTKSQTSRRESRWK